MLKSALLVLASVVATATPMSSTRHATVTAAATNTICPVCGKAIEPGQGTKVTIRGHEYSVDEKGCGDALTADPDRYLEPDGTPKNDKK